MRVKLNFPIPKGVADVIYSDEIGDTPANCNLKTRIIKVNPEYWKTFDDDRKFYVIYHEAGHINLQTHNELEADEYASDMYLKSGRSPKKSVYAISKVLPLTNYEQRKRLENQLERASEYDYEINNNPNALKILRHMNEHMENELDEFESNYFGADDDSDDDNFKGKWRAKREEKHERKENKKNSKIERKNAKSAAHTAKVDSKNKAREQRAEAKLLKSKNGDDSGSGSDIFAKAMEGVKTVGGAVSQIRGKSADGGESGEGEGKASEGGSGSGDDKIMGMKPTTFYMAVGGFVIVVGTILYLVFKPKKAKTA
jgi:hypothetical protein